MPLGLQIYFIGYVVAFIVCVQYLKDKDGRISLSNTFACVLLGLFSWIIVLAIWVGQNIKHGHDK